MFRLHKHLTGVFLTSKSGGLELLFGNVRKHDLKIPAEDAQGQPSNVNFLIHHLCDKYMKDQRREMFLLNGTVYVPLVPLLRCLVSANDDSRPGILVLINDADWELEGEDKYEIQNGDNILFVSTLHGG